MIWDDDKIVATDFETSGTLPEYALQPWRLPAGDFWATSLSIIRFDGRNLVPAGSSLFPTADGMRSFLQAAIDNDWTVVGWNLVFDISVFIAHGLADLVYQVKWLDGMLLWRHLDVEPEYELDRSKKRAYKLKPDAIDRFLPMLAGYEEDVDFHSTDPEELNKLQKYNDRDSVAAWIIARNIWADLNERQRNAALIECECLPMVAEANLHGLPVDTLAAHELEAHLTDTAAKMLEKLAPHGVTEKVVRSPMQLQKLLFDEWKLPVYKENTGKKTGKVSRSTDKEVLHELAFVDDRCRDLRSYREALNNRTKFAQTPLVAADYNGDGMARPSAIVFGTYSGRLTYGSKQGKNKDERQTGFALHQEKRGSEFRSIIVPPPGYTLVEFDAAGQEFRWMAILANDPVMLQLCQPGEDAHAYMGARIVNKDYRFLQAAAKVKDSQEEADRYLGKVANLCVAEGTTILTDRGPCSIEHVRDDDLVWDGEQFVAHDGLSFSGVRDVITYQGVTATPDHKVLVDGSWIELQEASRHGRTIESALGAGRTSPCRAALRIMDGLIRRAVHSIWGSLRYGSLSVWTRERSEPEVHGDRPIWRLHQLCRTPATPPQRQTDHRYARQETTAETRQRDAAALSKFEGPIVPQLWRARNRVPVRNSEGGCRVYPLSAAGEIVRRLRHRSHQQRWSLRAWKLALGYAQGEPGQPRQVRTYDIVNCGPNTRFAANGLIVHNSLQYRTYPKTLRKVARVQYNIPMELPEAQRIHRTYQSTYTQVPTYWQKQIEKVKKAGFAETLAGRRVQVAGKWDGPLSWQMEGTSLNYPVQGTGADQKYLALKVLKPYLLDVCGRFAWDLHDGIYLWVPDDKVEKVLVEGRRLLNHLPYESEWGFTPPIPLPWDAKFGKSWGVLKEWEDG